MVDWHNPAIIAAEECLFVLYDPRGLVTYIYCETVALIKFSNVLGGIYL